MLTSELRLVVSALLVACVALTGCSDKDKHEKPGSGSPSDQKSGQDSSDKDAASKKTIDFLIAQGKKALEQKRYQDAKELFEGALDLDPHDHRAKSGLDDAKEGLKADKASGDKDALYAEYMKTGNAAMADKKFAVALTNFRRAYELTKDEEANTAMIAAQKALDADTAEKAKLADFDAQIKAGDQLVATKNYKDALVAFNKALNLLPNDPVAIKKVADVEKRLDDINKNRSEKDKYDSLIADGRRALDDKHFDSAIKSFTKANNLIPQELEATQLLKDAKDKQKQAKADYDAAMLQGNSSAQSLMFDIARAYYEQALQAYPDNADKVAAAKKAVLQAETNIVTYNQAIVLGKQFMKKKLYAAAMEQFNLALTLSPLDATASALLKEASDKLQDIKAAYDKAVTAGSRALDQKNFSEALKRFDEALQLAPGDVVATAGRQKAEDGLHQQKFDAAVKAGDAAQQAKNYKEAVRQYEIALTEKPGDAIATGKLNQAKVLAK